MALEMAPVHIFDDLPLRRATLQKLLEGLLEGAAITSSGLSSAAGTRAGQDDAAGLVIVNAGSRPVAAVRPALGEVAAAHPAARVLVLSDLDDAGEAVLAFAAGCHAYVVTDLDLPLLAPTIEFVARGGTYFPVHMLAALEAKLVSASGRPRPWTPEAPETAAGRIEGLTRRQNDVLDLLAKGLSNKEIARQLKLSEATVKVHVGQIMIKLDAHNRTEAALKAVSAPRDTAAPVRFAPPQHDGGAGRPARTIRFLGAATSSRGEPFTRGGLPGAKAI